MHNPPLCQLWELQEGGRYTLDDLMDMHEALDVEDENERRMAVARETKPRGGR